MIKDTIKKSPAGTVLTFRHVRCSKCEFSVHNDHDLARHLHSHLSWGDRRSLGRIPPVAFRPTPNQGSRSLTQKTATVFLTVAVLLLPIQAKGIEDSVIELGAGGGTETSLWGGTGSTQVVWYGQRWQATYSGYICQIAIRNGFSTSNGTPNSTLEVAVRFQSSPDAMETGTLINTFYINEADLPQSATGDTTEYTTFSQQNCFAVQENGYYSFVFQRTIATTDRPYKAYLAGGTNGDGTSCEANVPVGLVFCGGSGVEESSADLKIRLSGYEDENIGAWTDPGGYASDIDLIGADEFCKGEFTQNTATESASLVVTAGRGIGYALCYAGGFLVIPSTESKEHFRDSLDLLNERIPVSYFREFGDIIENLSETPETFPTISIPLDIFGASSEIEVLSSASAYKWIDEDTWETLRGIASIGLYVSFGFAVFYLGRRTLHTL